MIRKARLEEIDLIMEILDEGRKFLREAGVDQWQGYEPSRETVLKDIERGESYLVFDKDEALGSFMLSFSQDSTYRKIDGAWLSDGAYSTIHRIAVRNNSRRRGIGREIFSYVFEETRAKGFKSSRIDTHKDNKPMTRLIAKMGYEHTGKIWLEDKSEREAYEKILL